MKILIKYFYPTCTYKSWYFLPKKKPISDYENLFLTMRTPLNVGVYQ